MSENWQVYIIETENNTLYTGITNNLENRWNMHLQGKGAKYLRAHKPKAIVFTESKKDRGEASSRESEIKKLSRAQKIKLIADTEINELLV